jgi:hypothetical protein
MKNRKDLQGLVLRPHWPEGLEQGRFYQFNCDDDGRDGDALRAASDQYFVPRSDAPKDFPNNFPKVCVEFLP